MRDDSPKPAVSVASVSPQNPNYGKVPKLILPMSTQQPRLEDREQRSMKKPKFPSHEFNFLNPMIDDRERPLYSRNAKMVMKPKKLPETTKNSKSQKAINF